MAARVAQPRTSIGRQRSAHHRVTSVTASRGLEHPAAPRLRRVKSAQVVTPLGTSPGGIDRRRPCWQGLPEAELIAHSREALCSTIDLPYTPAEYLFEAEAMQMEHSEATWHRGGKPCKICLGPRTQPGDWAKYRKTCPKTLETAEKLLASFRDQDVEVSFGDILDYREGHLLGWHQDNMDLNRHTFTVVLTLASEGDGRFEWREIAADSHSLGPVTASSRPGAGDLAIHGLTCNNSLAHRVFWDVGRRATLVLFCRSNDMQKLLAEAGLESMISMRHWWSKELDTHEG